MEPSRKKGFGKTEEADIGLKKLYKRAVPRWSLTYNPSIFAINLNLDRVFEQGMLNRA